MRDRRRDPVIARPRPLCVEPPLAAPPLCARLWDEFRLWASPAHSSPDVQAPAPYPSGRSGPISGRKAGSAKSRIRPGPTRLGPGFLAVLFHVCRAGSDPGPSRVGPIEGRDPAKSRLRPGSDPALRGRQSIRDEHVRNEDAEEQDEEEGARSKDKARVCPRVPLASWRWRRRPSRLRASDGASAAPRHVLRSSPPQAPRGPSAPAVHPYAGSRPQRDTSGRAPLGAAGFRLALPMSLLG